MTSVSPDPSERGSRLVDPRGLRFAAWLTTGVLAAALATRSAWLLGAQTAVFASGALLGLRFAPYGYLFRTLIRPRLAPPGELEDQAPPRFAQAVGLAFALVGTIAFATGLVGLGLVATGFALVAAVLNAAFGLCLGCEMYLLIARSRARVRGTAATSPISTEKEEVAA